MANFRYSPMPMGQEEQQRLALFNLMQERKKYAKKNKNNWPTDKELEAYRKRGNK
jgi:hypothetical protein